MNEQLRLRALFWQFPLPDRSWPGSRRVGKQAFAALRRPTEIVPERQPPPSYAYGASRPVKGQVPVQASVDRAEPLSPTLVDVLIRTQSGTVIQILRSPEFGNYGSDPNDPGAFSRTVDPRRAVCAVLAPYAAARCAGGVGYW
jgi:hypothetical protein